MSRNCVKLLTALFVCLIQLFTAGPSASEVVDRIVAEVNNDIITMSELQYMAKSLEARAGVKPTGKDSREVQRQMLEALIDRKLAREEAKKRGLSLSEKEMSVALERFMRRNNIPNEEALKKALSQAGLTMEEVRLQISDQIIQDRLVMAMVGSKVVIQEADIRRVYDDMHKDGGGGVQLHLRSIKLSFPLGATTAQKDEMKQKAEAIIKEAQSGATFPELAQKLAVSPTDLGFVALDDINPKLAEHLSKLKPKEVAPVETPEGFQLFQMVERRTGQARSFEEAAPQIREMLMGKELEKHFHEWVKSIRAKAHIKIMLQ
jgi:peptidyl-prolyl cis-trans isomerase SurA